MITIINKVAKTRFQATYSIEKTDFLKKRFYDLENGTKATILPVEIEVTHFEDVTTYSLEEGHSYLQTHLGNNIGLYEFYISQENVLVEKFYMCSEIFHLKTVLTHEDQIKEFYQLIFPIFGVVLFGEFDTNEEFLVRDDVCSKIVHDCLKKHTVLDGTWWDDFPYVNHYFIYHKSGNDITDIMALGGQPLERWIEQPTVTAATFFLGKYIDRKGDSAIIKNSDDMKTVKPFEENIIETFIKALEDENVKYRIDYIAF